VKGLKDAVVLRNRRGTKERKPCLEIPGPNGDTPLHMALSEDEKHAGR
jgi:hypothetical protein